MLYNLIDRTTDKCLMYRESWARIIDYIKPNCDQLVELELYGSTGNYIILQAN